MALPSFTASQMQQDQALIMGGSGRTNSAAQSMQYYPSPSQTIITDPIIFHAPSSIKGSMDSR